MSTNNIRAKEKSTWIWIKQRLYHQESSLSKLALSHGVKRQIFSRVKHFPIPKYERIIAEAIGNVPWSLWPHRYNADHQPNRISSRYPQHKNFIDHSENIRSETNE